MDTKRQRYWKDYSKKIVEMTSTKHRQDPIDAFLCLNKALLDLYKVKENNGGQKEFNRYAGYCLRFVVLLDTIAMKGSDCTLDYNMDDPNLFDPLDKSVILNVATSLSGIARTFWVQKTVHNRGDPDRYEWESLDYTPAGRPATCWSWPLQGFLGTSNLTPTLPYARWRPNMSIFSMAEDPLPPVATIFVDRSTLLCGLTCCKCLPEGILYTV
jgi:hypothetical protein